MRSVLARLGESAASFGAVFANAALRRIQLAWAASTIGAWAYGTALAVYAYEADGAYAVGLVGLIRWVVAAVAAPLTGVAADRTSRVLVMFASDALRVAVILVMGLVASAGGSSYVVYAVSILVTVASSAFRPAQAALLPALARTPQELAASNVTASTIESVGIFVGPALGGILLALTGTGTVFFVTAALFSLSAYLVLRLPRDRDRPAREEEEPAGALRDLADGARTLVAEPQLALLVGLFAAQTFVDGLLGVLVVVLALDVLDLGEAGVGFLNSAGGIGGLAGAVVAAALVARSRLATDFGLGILIWGAPVVLVGLVPGTAIALVAMALVGVGNTIVDVTGDTLLQRGVRDDVLARVFGLMESLMLVTVALGSALAPVLLDLFGARVALVVTGAILPVLAAVTWRRLAAIDDAAAVPAHEVGLLRGLPMFAPLPEARVEQLAARLERHRVSAGDEVIREGDPGDRFYVVETGRFDVSADGRPRTSLGRGEFFGEIALLRDVPRTATVVAAEDGELLSLGRDEFVAAVTGHAESEEAAALVVGARLGAPAVGLPIG